jgi:hypothetical protein
MRFGVKGGIFFFVTASEAVSTVETETGFSANEKPWCRLGWGQGGVKRRTE